MIWAIDNRIIVKFKTAPWFYRYIDAVPIKSFSKVCRKIQMYPICEYSHVKIDLSVFYAVRL